jgi:hypothetical protein
MQPASAFLQAGELLGMSGRRFRRLSVSQDAPQLER